MARPHCMLLPSRGHTEVVRVLPGAGADVNKRRTDDGEILSMVSGQGRTEIVRLLLDAGADPNAATADGTTLPIAVSAQGRAEIVRLLLDAGADPNAATADGETALHFASQWTRLDVVDLLIEAGAEVNRVSSKSHTPLTSSVCHGEDSLTVLIAQRLAMAGANLEYMVFGDWNAATIANIASKPRTAAWLSAVSGFSLAQICVSLGDGRRLCELLRRQECDTSSEYMAVAERFAVAENKPRLQLWREAQLKWAPVRHRLLHPAHRSTVACLMLIARRVLVAWQGLGLSVPAEVWFTIAEHLGRTGWPDLGRRAIAVW